MQQQVRRNPLQQPVRPDQLRRPLVALRRIDRQRPEHPRHQPHRALPDRVAPINLLELSIVAAREPAGSPSPCSQAGTNGRASGAALCGRTKNP